LALDFVIVLIGDWLAVEFIPEFMFLHVMFVGERLQIAELIEGEEIFDDFRCILHKGHPIFEA
jgi:hypothetical protein